MDNFECVICSERFEDPVECLNCNNNICKKHAINIKNGCPFCKILPFKYRENIWLKRTLLNLESLYQCDLCGYEGEINAFWSHLIDHHKNDIIEKFNKKNDKSKQKKETNKLPNNNNNVNNNNEDKKINQPVNINANNQSNYYPSFSLLNNNNLDNNNNYKNNMTNETPLKESNYPINNNNNNNYNNNRMPFSTHRKSYPTSQNQKEFTNQPPSTERNKIIQHCHKKNEFIKCNCCPNHMCEDGCCLCVECMRKYVKKYNLTNGELINKAGKIARLFKGSFYCGTQYDSIIENILGRQFKKHSQCQYPSEPCNDCKVLTKFKEIYYSYL